MLNKKPSKAVEKAWLQRVANYGCVVTGQSNIQLHHCVGREGKHNKYHIGRWFVLPLAFDLHDVSSNNEYNITHHRKAFVQEYGREGMLFLDMCICLEEDEPLPFDIYISQAILGSRR